MLHILVEPKGNEAKYDYYCGHSDGMIACARSPAGLNAVVEEAHGELLKISRD